MPNLLIAGIVAVFILIFSSIGEIVYLNFLMKEVDETVEIILACLTFIDFFMTGKNQVFFCVYKINF